MFSFARAYLFLLNAERQPASPAVAEPLDGLLARLVSAPIEWVGSLGRRERPPAPRLRAVESTPRRSTPAPRIDSLRPAA